MKTKLAFVRLFVNICCEHPTVLESHFAQRDLEGYLLKNVERLRSYVGSRWGVVRLTYMPLHRGFFFDVDNKAKQSYISDAWIGDCACNRPFLILPGGKGGDAHTLHDKALTLWDRGEDIVDYGTLRSVFAT